MNKIAVTLGIALASFVASSAFAQVKGEVDPAQSVAPKTAKVSAEDKQSAKIKRKAEGTAAAKQEARDMPSSGGVAKVATKDEKQAAAIKRKAAAAEAVKKGEIPSGTK